MTRHRRIATTVFAVVSLAGLAGGCSGSAASNNAALRQAHPRAGVSATASPNPLLPPSPKTAAQRLIEQAARIFDFCQTWNNILQLPEPRPDDLRELAVYGRFYTTILKSLDPTATMQRGQFKWKLDQQAITWLDDEQRLMYGYDVLVTKAQQAAQRHGANDPHVQQLLSQASLLLAGPTYSAADDNLSSLYYYRC
jgi:hypothetical protein